MGGEGEISGGGGDFGGGEVEEVEEARRLGGRGGKLVNERWEEVPRGRMLTSLSSLLSSLTWCLKLGCREGSMCCGMFRSLRFE